MTKLTLWNAKEIAISRGITIEKQNKEILELKAEIHALSLKLKSYTDLEESFNTLDMDSIPLGSIDVEPEVPTIPDLSKYMDRGAMKAYTPLMSVLACKGVPVETFLQHVYSNPAHKQNLIWQRAKLNGETKAKLWFHIEGCMALARQYVPVRRGVSHK